MGVTIGIAIITGAFSGFICSKFGRVELLFDDKDHFHGCEFDIDPDHKAETKHEIKEINTPIPLKESKEEHQAPS